MRRHGHHARLISALALAAATAMLAAPAAADPTPSPSGSTVTLPVAITLDALRPVAPQPGDTLVVAATLRNVSTAPVTNLAVQLLLSRTKVLSRGQFDDYADTADGSPPTDAVTLPTSTVSLPSPELTVADTERVTVSVPVDDLQLPENWQVYELALSVTGLTETGESTVGQLRTFLPWATVDAPGVGVPTRLAWVWPLVDRPHRIGDSTWTDDDLATELAPQGRLNALVAAGAAAEAQQPPPPPPTPRHRKHRHNQPRKPSPPPQPTVTPVPITWAIDPLLVDDATRMSAGYKVGTGADRHAGSGRQVASAWLDQLSSATARGEVIGLPYADPDIVAAARWGLDNAVQNATTAGQTLLGQALGTTPLGYSWPPDGLADQRTLDTLFAGGVTTVVLDSDALPPSGGAPSETPSAHATVPSRDAPVPLTALLSDHTLTSVVEGGAAPGQGPLAIQRMLSELLMVQAERPADQRSLVVAPDRRWAPDAAYVDQLLADTGRVPWIEPITLSQVADSPVYDLPRGPLTYPAAERNQQLHHGYLDSVKALQSEIDAFAAILPPADPQARAFDSGVMRLLSSAWRSDPGGARDRRKALTQVVDSTMGRVHIASRPGSLVTLTSHSGTVPVTVTNDLDTPVNVVVGIEDTPRLDVKSGRVARTIGPHRQKTVDVRATAKTSGVFPLTVTLYTPAPSNVRYGHSVLLLVRSTAYGSTAILITGGATAVLLLTVAVRIARRARGARRTARSTT
ncbi:MAG: hypothetical protein QOJ03_312 [Frankiaceae bacterium]|nr:hypothetical protein [Frankiaceae bacterium]